MNDVNRKKRLDFAEKYKDWSVNQWKKVLWSDETIYTLRSKLPRKNWRLKNEKYVPGMWVRLSKIEELRFGLALVIMVLVNFIGLKID